ncbi:alpha/beta hydrolase [uncultured Gimesia sp.]|uniref:alpha/beta hydrolase n=1 Tax=uncultured Gimesia sp. TaxID=1678688 RepID=UPI0030D90639|tara:strand:- start:80799 stop:81656 length:858 start_codon:yes stop_codon:yes gene_type:complete
MKIVFIAAILTSLLIPIHASRADDDIKITPDVVYGHKFGMALTFDVYQPQKQANGAGVLFMVSGGWYSKWTDPKNMVGRFKPLLDEGFTVFSVRHGSSPKFIIPEVVDDVRRSVRFIRLHSNEYGVRPNQLGVWGGSAGGHLSLVLGTTSDEGNPKEKDIVLQSSDRVAAVVAYYPPTDLREFVDEKSPYYHRFPALQFDVDLADDFSPVLHVTQDDPPTLLIHGDQDKLVPISHSENIMKQFQAQKVPAELLVIKDAAHGFQGDDKTRASQAVVKWFKQHLLQQ